MFIILILTLIIVSYWYVKHKYSYWKRMGIPYIEPEFPYGNFKTMSRTENIAHMFRRFYNETKAKGPIVGLWIFLSPCIMINDLEMIKKILIKDFQFFTDRGMYHNEKDDPLSLHLFVISGAKWRKYRTLLTPAFTSGKMKYMFPAVAKVGESLTNFIKKEIKIDSVVEMKDLCGRFTIDVISSVAFGFESNSIENPNCEVRVQMNDVFSRPKLIGLSRIFTSYFPAVARTFHVKSLHDNIITYFTDLITSVVEYREKNSVYRKDFLQMLIQLKNKGRIEGEEESVNYRDSKLTLTELIAQSFVFFVAGFETSATLLSYIFLELSQKLDLQERARQEVLRVLEKYDGQYTYDAIGEMKYLDQILKEALRLYSPVQNLQRRAEADYKETTTGITIKKGTLVYIPIFGIHHDPEYFPNPMEFDPERYSEEKENKRVPQTFLAFGDGPRNCIGLRFGKMESKLALAMMLANFKFTLNSKSAGPLKYTTKTFILRTEGGLYLNVEELINK